MAATKEAIAIVLDVGPSMCSAAPGEATSLQMAIQAITMILQRKMFSESKDEVALVLFGTQDTENPLVDGDSYEHVSIARHLAVADFELLQMVQNDIQPGDSPADFIDAMVVAMDHMESGLQGKRGFGSKRLIVLSDLASPFGDDQLETVMDVIQKFNVEINFIGPDLDDEEEDKGEGGGGGGEGGASSGGGGGGGQKEKTPQQRAGEAMAKYMLEKTGGASYSFNEALPALSYFQSRQVRPTAWKCVLEIGPNLKIPINGYIKVKEFKLKQSWKRVYAKDPDMAVKTERTFHLDDEEKTEVDRDDIVEGYCYGSDRVPMTAEDKESMKYQSEKCLKVLGFTKAENVRRSHYMGDSCLSVSAEKGDEAAAVALSALINALYETNCVAIARRVYAARNAPRIGCLLPQIKAGYECLYWIELPFAEDLRTYTFGSLPTKDNIAFNKKYAPSEEQLTAVDNLITSMDLSTAAEDEDGEKCEAFKPKLMFNPYFQRVYQCLQHRALHPEDPIPELSPLIARSLQRPQAVEATCQVAAEKLGKAFKLERVTKRKEEKTGEAMFKENGAEQVTEAKRPKVDDDLAGGIEGMTKAKVTEVGTVTPIEDFQDLISRKDQDLFEEACRQMEDRVSQLVMDSFGQQFYGKAMDCLKTLRQEAIKKSEPGSFNDFIQDFKDTLIEKGKRDFWDRIVQEKQGLISKVECEESEFSKEEADTFIADEVKKEEAAPAQEEETADDLLADL
ncbi:X-ray repair cross-complementing protein 5-like [Babylonia areolata]|uniref:X-ray repair cross-complementing protein 5-like n=1 Tax=Babylonia areolata TaxID=304850 RepID=UPI003FD34E4C